VGTSGGLAESPAEPRRISTSGTVIVVDLDDLDRGLIQALALHGRASFSELAGALGVSDQTVARRYRRLRESGRLRVVGLPDTVRLGRVRWSLRLRCAPGAAPEIAAALARRPDTAWVRLLSGGTEVVCAARAPEPGRPGSPLLDRLPRTPRVTDVSAHLNLHMFMGGPLQPALWSTALSAAQIARLDPPRTVDGPAAPLTEADAPMLDVLAVDGRAGYPQLAAATGWSESAVRRRLGLLLRTGALYLDLDLGPDTLEGTALEVSMWLSVAPDRLAEVGTALAALPEAPYVAATTGPTNLEASLVFRDGTALYEFMTKRIGALPGIHGVETAPVLRTVKRAGSVQRP
jgi:DNA-binding Lrp family transcriptional regulator